MRATSVLQMVVLAATVVSGCQSQTPEQWAEALPDLPADLAATIDPATMATRVDSRVPEPTRDATTAAVAPCCGSTDDKQLRVTMAYTKCGPLLDFVVATSSGVLMRARPGPATSPTSSTPPTASTPSEVRHFKLREFAGKAFLDRICVTSNGPWDATLTEQRSCIGYNPTHRLVVAAFGDLVTFNWNGGVENHPTQVGLVSCRQISTARFSCGGPSSCTCTSSSCPPGQACACTLPW